MYHEPKFEPSREEMFQILSENIHMTGRVEHVSIWEADGRYAAEDIVAKYSLPNRPASDFDGISVYFDDFSDGMPDTSKWIEGKDFAYSNTGVAISEGFDTVIAIEEVTKHEDGTITIGSVPAARGEHITPVGAQLREGEILAKKGEQIHPALIGILTEAGYQNVPVFCKPRVVFLPTGDELVPSGGVVPAGMNVESNGAMVSAFVRRFGGDSVVTGILSDDMSVLKKELLNAVSWADLVIIGAGSSKGSKDFTMDVLETVGTVLVQEIGVAPGKHCSLTMVENTPVLGIPGPPGGAQLACQYYVKAAMELMLTGSIAPVRKIPAVLDADWDMSEWRLDFLMPMALSLQEDGYHVTPIQGWGFTRAESRCNQYVLTYFQKGRCYKKGEQVLAELVFPEITLGNVKNG